jgi:hypothetical protein
VRDYRVRKRIRGGRPNKFSAPPPSSRERPWFYSIWLLRAPDLPEVQLELELIQTQMAQKPIQRAEVQAHALRAGQNVKKDEVWVGARCAFWWAGRRRVREWKALACSGVISEVDWLKNSYVLAREPHVLATHTAIQLPFHLL